MARQARAQATRQRLLHATTEALVECGYAGTTTQEVCRRVNCSRGTLLYHFPTREDLLVAALHFVLSNRVEDFVAEHHKRTDMDTAAFLESLWQQWQGPALVAWLELAVAARSNPGLREPMRQTMQDFEQQILTAFRTLKPLGELATSVEAVIPFFVFAVLNGLSVGLSYADASKAAPILELMTRLGDDLKIKEASR